MKFISTASAGDVTTYRAKGYAIVHQLVGFEIPKAQVFTVNDSKQERLQHEYAGKRCLEDAMEWCRKHAAHIPEMDFATHSEMTR